MDKNHPSVIFLHVTDAQTKIGRIIATVQQHFASGERILIQVPNDQAANYIDDLFWKSPPESFLPHIISKTECRDRVVITTGKANLNKASILLNLGLNIPEDPSEYEIIYELNDETHPTKAEQSRRKAEDYRLAGIIV